MERGSRIIGNQVELFSAHLVGGECSRLVGADDGRASESLDGGKLSDDGIVLGHSSGSEGEAGGDDGGESFRDGSDGESNGYLEVVEGSLDPVSSEGLIVEVGDVHQPADDADAGDGFGEVFSELIDFLLEW